MKMLGTHAGHYDETGQIHAPIDLVQFNLVASPDELRKLAIELIETAQHFEQTDEDHAHPLINPDFVICRDQS